MLVDDEEAVLRLISRFLRPKFDVVATGRNGREAVSIALDLQPDLLVLDIGVPVLHGLDVLGMLRKHGTTTKVVFLSTLADRHLSEAAIASGAHGFVFKSRMYEDLPKALDTSLAGQTFVSLEEIT